MTLVKLNPRGSLDLLPAEESLSRLVDDLLRPFNTSLVESGYALRPAANLAETKEAYEISLELPGVDKKALEINIEDGVLSISGKREEEKKEEGKDYHRIEHRYGSFHRAFRLPHEVEADKIKATYRDGVLQVTVPKSAEAKKKTVKVEVQ